MCIILSGAYIVSNVIETIKLLKQHLGLSNPELSKMLGFKSDSHVWMIEAGHREPSFLFCRRLVKAARDYCMMELTIDMLMDDDDADERSSKSK